MRLFPRFISVYLLPALAFSMLLAGCGRSHRPESALSEQDRTVLADYEKIRAGLASDNSKSAKAAGADLVAYLKKEPASAASNRLIQQAQAVADARALDSMRDLFRALSNTLIPVANGVDGYYIMTCPPGFQGDWIQRTPEVDNPYFGKVSRSFGLVKK